MLTNRKVLIVDDEEDLCLLLKDYFTKMHSEVCLCHSIAHAKMLLPDFQPDLLFLDYNLPDGLGWEWAPEIITQYPDMHIVLISAYHPELPALRKDAPFTVIEKPISIAELDKQVVKITGQKLRMASGC